MLIAAVAKKCLVSAARGEYVDFVMSRAAFTLFNVGTALILFSINGARLSRSFLLAAGTSEYLGYILVGSLLYAVTQSVFLNVSRSLMTELRLGTLEACLLAPYPRLSYYAGTQLAQLISTGIDLGIGLLIALLLRIRLSLDILCLFSGFLLLQCFLFGISVLTALLMIRLRDTFFIQNTILPLLIILGGYLFPIEVLPAPLRCIAEFLPLSRAVALIRAGALAGVGPASFDGEFVVALVFSLGMAILGVRLLPRTERGAAERCLS